VLEGGIWGEITGDRTLNSYPRNTPPKKKIGYILQEGVKISRGGYTRVEKKKHENVGGPKTDVGGRGGTIRWGACAGGKKKQGGEGGARIDNP